MRTQAPERASLPSVWAAFWRAASLAAAAALMFVTFVGLAYGRDDRATLLTALMASIMIGPFLVLPMTRKLVWLVLAAVAGLVMTAALAFVLP